MLLSPYPLLCTHHMDSTFFRFSEILNIKSFIRIRQIPQRRPFLLCNISLMFQFKILNIRVPSTIEYPCFLHYWKSVFPPLLNIRVSSTIEYPCSLHYWISKYCRRNLLMNLNIWKINDYLEMYYSIFKNIYTTVVSVKL